jgi:RNA polymerase sigma-70 factor (ECF subfamily)
MLVMSQATTSTAEADQIAAARGGDEAAFERLASAYRSGLHAHCYRMLGSVQDADDALQETLLAAWRGLPGFEGRSSLRSWLYRIATHACLRLASGRRRRVLTPDYTPARTDTCELGEPVTEPVWLEPYPDLTAGPDTDPEARYAERESVELAFVAALQHLPASPRAVLILREVLQFSAADVAQMLETSVASVNSSLQRARKTVSARQSGSQRAELNALGDQGQRELVTAFVDAWERADITALVSLLAEDARFSMPPLPAWFDGRADIGRFMTQRMWETPWRLVPARANGQLAVACYQGSAPGAPGAPETPFRLSAINVITLRGGRIAELTGFLDPAVHRRFGLAAELAGSR